MKLTIAIIVFIFTSSVVKTQQSKAYEMIRYTAQQNSTIFILNYADGYIGASTIKLKVGKTIILYRSESGSPDAGGSLRFTAEAKPGNFILLKDIDETTTAPRKLIADYHFNHHTYRLLFARNK